MPQIISENSMGTAAVIEALRFLVFASRPRTILEIGMGKTSVHLLDLLSELEKRMDEESKYFNSTASHVGSDLLDPTWRSHSDLYYLGIDAGTGKGTLYPEVEDKIANYPFAEVEVTDYKSILPTLEQKFDLIIADLGRPSDNLIILDSVVDILNSGGILVLHEPLELQPFESGTERFVQRGYSIPWNVIKSYPFEGFETLTIPEFHKTSQAGVAILRKKTSSEQARGTEGMLAELDKCQDIPIRNLTNLAKHASSLEELLTNSMRNGDFLKVMALMLLGETSLTVIAKKLDLDLRKVAKYADVLNQLQFAPSSKAPFNWLAKQPKHQSFEPAHRVVALSESNCARVVDYLFLPEQTYSERTVNWMLAFIQPDYAELRRRLVDMKLLNRDNETLEYWRNYAK